MAYKADLVNNFIEQNHSVSEALDGVVPEELVRICEVRLLSHLPLARRPSQCSVS